MEDQGSSPRDSSFNCFKRCQTWVNVTLTCKQKGTALLFNELLNNLVNYFM